MSRSYISPDQAAYNTIIQNNALKHLHPIIVAIKNQKLAFNILCPGEKIASMGALTGRPWLVLIGDDMGVAEGPIVFHKKSLTNIFKKSSGVIILSSDTSSLPYMIATKAALLSGGIILIETLPTHEKAWREFSEKYAPNVSVQIFAPDGNIQQKNEVSI